MSNCPIPDDVNFDPLVGIVSIRFLINKKEHCEELLETKCPVSHCHQFKSINTSCFNQLLTILAAKW